jgi:hypothetical protein
VRRLFAPEHRAEVVRRLRRECGRNLPATEYANAHDLERIRFAVLKLSGGDIAQLRDWIATTQLDWRDTLMASGFERLNAHEQWVAQITSLRKHPSA